MEELVANFTLENVPEIEVDFDLATPTANHNELYNRDLPNQHPISAITGLVSALDGKQEVLTAGDNIQITDNVISATDTTYTAGEGISIEDGVISATVQSAVWGNITGTLSDQTDLQNALNAKQNVISDLSTIRTNAQNGASAYSTIQNYGNIVTHNVNEFATAIQGALADTALQPSDLVGYATTTWVQNQGYALSSSLATVATSGSYNDLSNKPNLATVATTGAYSDLSGTPTIPIVNNATLTIQKNGSTVKTFTANASANVTANITVPTKVSDLNNDSGFITSSALNGYATTNYVDTADGNLQSQIDAITAASDVTDIVGTYAELQAYDTSTLPNNSIIKVLQDESRDDETTYYRWVITDNVGAWVLIGEEGPYYTKSQADSTFVPQTRTVNNKALSSNITLTYSDVGADASGAASMAETNAKNYADSLASNYATAAQGALADTALQNKATSSNSVTLFGTANTTSYYVNSMNIGFQSVVNGGNGTAVGYNSQAYYYGAALGSGASAGGQAAVAIGYGANASGISSIQIGYGTNAEKNTLYVGFYNSGSNINYKLLGSDGKIPTDRLTAFTGADGVTAGALGAVPAPTATDNTKFLRGDGTWATAGGGSSYIAGTNISIASDVISTSAAQVIIRRL